MFINFNQIIYFLDGLHTTAMIKVVVRDVNDNAPEFYPIQYNASLDEASSVGQEVVAVHARDADSGVNGFVTYRITSGNTQGYFSINSDTGKRCFLAAIKVILVTAL